MCVIARGVALHPPPLAEGEGDFFELFELRGVVKFQGLRGFEMFALQKF